MFGRHTSDHPGHGGTARPPAGRIPPIPRALGVLLLLLLATGCSSTPTPYVCSDAIGCVEIAAGRPVRIGAMQNLTGNGPPGLFMVHCTELAIEDRGGQLLGHPIEMVTADSRCSGEGGTTAALQLAADPQMLGIVGPSCSGEAETAMKVLSEAGMVLISGSATASSLTSVGGVQGSAWRPGFLRTAQSDAQTGRAAAMFAFQERGLRRAATIHAGDPYTRGLTDTFRQTLLGLGGEVVLDAAVNKGDTDMRPVLKAVATSGAEILFFPVYEPEGDYLVLQAAEMEALNGVALLSAEGLYFETFVAAVGGAGVGVVLIAPTFAQTAEYDAVVSRYAARYQDPLIPIYDATTYDAAGLLLHAIEAVAEQDGDGTLHIGRAALRETLYTTAGYQGLSGTLACDRYGDCGASRFKAIRLDDPSAGLEGLADNVIWTYPPGE